MLDFKTDARVCFVVVPSGLCVKSDRGEEEDEEEEKLFHCSVICMGECGGERAFSGMRLCCSSRYVVDYRSKVREKG